MKHLLRASEVARLASVHVSMIYRMAARGTLPSIRIGRAVRFRREDVERLLGEGSEKASHEASVSQEAWEYLS